MNDEHIWLICYFVACTILLIALCVINAKDRGFLKVKDVGFLALVSYLPPFNILAIIFVVCELFGWLKDLVIWERKED
jgi:hypothetical protein